MGAVWALIIGNFVAILITVVGTFGAYQFRPRYLIMYLIWSFAWIACNVAVMLTYLEISIFKQGGTILTINTESASWWKNNGIGCTVEYESSSQTGSTSSAIIAKVTGCILEYKYVEVIHAGIQCFFSLLGIIIGSWLTHRLYNPKAIDQSANSASYRSTNFHLQNV
ncbi:Sodium/potassium-transporting ATPase subunit beta-1-interacting protein 3 [Trichoplax sp. H2]|nr:Sodium/potassium-transporting ATPase subunit beta-1-interacting protein 3 [Trichoplax sp. H2]|eukprot:RDD39321.1 Sodium/potassium-transporting ATPase subunit beta-1-interacting protein 3 [Trichoplax sp. H2]